VVILSCGGGEVPGKTISTGADSAVFSFFDRYSCLPLEAERVCSATEHLVSFRAVNFLGTKTFKEFYLCEHNSYKFLEKEWNNSSRSGVQDFKYFLERVGLPY
jgi:hypothetical protein